MQLLRRHSEVKKIMLHTMKFSIWKISYLLLIFFFSRLHRLKHHVNTIHLEERPLKCKFCSCQTSFEQESRLKCHISRVHKNDLVRLIRLYYLAKATKLSVSVLALIENAASILFSPNITKLKTITKIQLDRSTTI